MGSNPAGCGRSLDNRSDFLVCGGVGQAMPQPSKAFKHTLNLKHTITLNYFNRIIRMLKLNAILDFSPYAWHTDRPISAGLPKCRGNVGE